MENNVYINNVCTFKIGNIDYINIYGIQRTMKFQIALGIKS